MIQCAKGGVEWYGVVSLDAIIVVGISLGSPPTIGQDLVLHHIAVSVDEEIDLDPPYTYRMVREYQDLNLEDEKMQSIFMEDLIMIPVAL